MCILFSRVISSHLFAAGVKFSTDSQRRDVVKVHGIPACLVEREVNEKRRGRQSVTTPILQVEWTIRWTQNQSNIIILNVTVKYHIITRMCCLFISVYCLPSSDILLFQSLLKEQADVSYPRSVHWPNKKQTCIMSSIMRNILCVINSVHKLENLLLSDSIHACFQIWVNIHPVCSSVLHPLEHLHVLVACVASSWRQPMEPVPRCPRPYIQSWPHRPAMASPYYTL